MCKSLRKRGVSVSGAVRAFAGATETETQRSGDAYGVWVTRHTETESTEERGAPWEGTREHPYTAATLVQVPPNLAMQAHEGRKNVGADTEQDDSHLRTLALLRGEPFPSIMYSGRWEEKHL